MELNLPFVLIAIVSGSLFPYGRIVGYPEPWAVGESVAPWSCGLAFPYRIKIASPEDLPLDLRARLHATSALVLFLLPLALRAQEQPAPPSHTDAAPATAATPQQHDRANMTGAPAGAPAAHPAEEDLPIPAETTSVTHHDWTAGSRPVHYTATAGILLIHGESQDAKPIGSMFYVAYTEDGAPAKSRPLTFFYNGGPGSATIWLHMGSMGPIRVVTKSPAASGAPPYEWVSNQYSLLDKTDLVFVDAPLTGYSRLVGKGKATDFQGVDQDVRAFNKFITRYITVNQRWASPKYLFGESYGTPRSAALVASLNNDGIAFNGVTLLSSVLNYFVNSPGYDLDTKRYIPSYAAIAWYHNKVPHTGTMKDFVQKARVYARRVRHRAGSGRSAASRGVRRRGRQTGQLYRPLRRVLQAIQAPHRAGALPQGTPARQGPNPGPL
jgi:carboxypeptidase C (cathepsin A)